MSKMLKTTQIALKMLEKVINAEIHIDGKEYLDLSSQHPVIFVVNHFTRAETFILPYVMYKETNKIPHSLADGSLFHGRFGEFLSSMGALRYHQLIFTLMDLLIKLSKSDVWIRR